MRLPAQGRWNPEQHHRWSPRQEGGEPGPEEMEPWSPGLGILQPSLCTQPQPGARRVWIRHHRVGEVSDPAGQ